jgi:hypothetical protein
VVERSVWIGSVVAALIVALVLVNQWRGRARDIPANANAAAEAPGVPVSSTPRIPGAQDSRTASEASVTAALASEDTGEAPQDAVPAEQDLEALVRGIDPLLGNRNLIVRAPDPATDGPGLVDIERRFQTEGTDPAWSERMESQILDTVSRVGGLNLITFDAQCRETVCRIKLFYPPRTDALSSLEQLKPLATQLGFGRIVEAATIGEDGAPMALLYLQREGA